MKVNNKKMEVSAIENGTVIDHIPTSVLFKVLDLLGLETIEQQVIIATNLSSNRIGRKALIKLVDRYCGDYEMNYLALVAPMARISTIKDFTVIEKRDVESPMEVKGFVACANPMCITNHEKVEQSFKVQMQAGELRLKCHYCEKSTMQEQIEIIRKK